MQTTDEVNAQALQPGLMAEYLQETGTLHTDFDNLAAMAVKMTGLQACLINLVDTDLQWTIGSHGSPLDQFPADRSVCQYTILEDMPFEVQDLTQDIRFQCLKSVRRSGFRYYYGVPLRSPDGLKIGTLCVLDAQPGRLAPPMKELLKMVAGEAAQKLEAIRAINGLQQKLDEAIKVKRMLAHDIRGPLHGIQGLSCLALEDLRQNKHDELPVCLEYIAQSGHSLLHLTDSILAAESNTNGDPNSDISFGSLRQQVCRLLLPVVRQKRIQFSFEVAPDLRGQPVRHSWLLQAVINLAGNAIKFTPHNGKIRVALSAKRLKEECYLCLTVSDNGIGMTEEVRQRITSGLDTSTPGTQGEEGSGLGLRMIRDWLKESCGRLRIRSVLGEGTTFTVVVPN